MNVILETLAKVGFDWRMGLFHFINFLIVFLVLKRFVFVPLVRIIREREEKIREGVENFQRSKTELQMSERRGQELVDEAKVEASKIIEAAHNDALAVTATMKEKAKKEIELLVVQAKKNIEIERGDMREAVKQEMVGLIIAAVEKIVRERLDAKKDEQYILDIITSIETKKS